MKRYMYIVPAVFIGIVLTLGVFWYQQQQISVKSVEFNLAELSPDGPSAGYAMPASCESNVGAVCNDFPPNFCGMEDKGNRTCSGSCSGDASVPDNICINFPITLTYDPQIVRQGSSITLTWDIGLNYPTNCTLTGPSLEGFVFTDAGFPGSTQTGGVNILVTGPHRFTLSCGSGTSQATVDVRVLPELYES